MLDFCADGLYNGGTGEREKEFFSCRNDHHNR